MVFVILRCRNGIFGGWFCHEDGCFGGGGFPEWQLGVRVLKIQIVTKSWVFVTVCFAEGVLWKFDLGKVSVGVLLDG